MPLASASWELAALAYLAGARPALPALALALLYCAAAISSSGWERYRWPDCCLLFSGELLKPRRGDGGLRGEPRAKGRDGEDGRASRVDGCVGVCRSLQKGWEFVAVRPLRLRLPFGAA